MKPVAYPFAAVVDQDEMKLALLLAAVDWRLGVLLRGDKGSGKTTTARGLASLLPSPAPFINLPIGATEDRLLGGLHLERTLQGDPVLKPGLLSEAHGGVLYVDEVNLLPTHLGDALLDAAASGINVVEREGLSASHPAEFVLLGSMNPEEGSLRPQLLDRFALSVTIEAPRDPVRRAEVMKRRMAFERDPDSFADTWSAQQNALRMQIGDARRRLQSIACPADGLGYISALISERGIRSMRADLAVMRAATAYAALTGSDKVDSQHVEVVAPLALAHRQHDMRRPPSPPPSSPRTQKPNAQEEESSQGESSNPSERIFEPHAVEAPFLHMGNMGSDGVAHNSSIDTPRGNAVRAQKSSDPKELDLRATLSHALREKGSMRPEISDLHERMRESINGTRYLLVIDSSGSHAVRERMRLVKGAAVSLLKRSFKRGDEVAIVVFRGISAEVCLEPTTNLADALSSLEYLPTGGRTPLAHALELARSYITSRTLLILMTDGRANYPLNGGDPWEEAISIAGELKCPAVVVDTETAVNPVGRAALLAASLRGRDVSLDDLIAAESFAAISS